MISEEDIGTEVEVRDLTFEDWKVRTLREIRNDSFVTDSPYASYQFPNGLGIWKFARKRMK